MKYFILRQHPYFSESFRLDGWHAKYRDGCASVEDAAAAIINDRRLYVMPSAAISRDASGMDGCAFIYA